MKKINVVFLIVLSLHVITVYTVFLLFDDNIKLALGREDGVFETLGSISFLIASIFFFLNYLKSKKGNNLIFIKTRKNILFLLLSIIFFIGFGEEISWGQRIFNVETPEYLKEINLQNEINIHNINIFHGKKIKGDNISFTDEILDVDRLFSFFWFTFCFAIPLFSKMNEGFREFILKVNVPLIPLWIGSFFILNYVLSKVFEPYVSLQCQHSLIEVKESNIAFLFFIVSLYVYFELSRDVNILPDMEER